MGAVSTSNLETIARCLTVVAAVRLFGEFDYAAKSWPQPYRVVLKAEVLAGSNGLPAKDNQRYVVTSLRGPTPSAPYRHVYCQRGQAENWIKQVKSDLASDRTSASTFIANFARLLLTGAAYVLHQQLRLLGLHDTELATAQPKTVILSLFKIAVRVKQYKDRVLLHLPSACRQRRCWQRSVGGSAPINGQLPCWLLHERARLAHETAPPTLPNNESTLYPRQWGWGSVAKNSKKLRCRDENARQRIYATFRLESKKSGQVDIVLSNSLFHGFFIFEAARRYFTSSCHYRHYR